MRSPRRWLIAVVSLALLSGCGRTPAPTGYSSSAYLLVIDRSGGEVYDDDGLNAWFNGDGFASFEAVTAAVCANAYDWRDDISLNRSVLFAWRRDLVRVAEMLAEHVVDPVLAFHVESRVAAVDGDLARLGPIEGYDSRTVAEYLVQRAKGPSVESVSRFVVYAVQRTLATQRIVFFDSQAPTGHTGSWFGSSELPVHLPDGTYDSINRERCPPRT